MNKDRVLVIAEAGVNHNGSLQLAKDLIDVAANAGADIVKFQTFKAEKLASARASQADYQITNMGKKQSQLEMLRKLELTHESHIEMAEHCKKRNIQFLSTAFDEESLSFLVVEMNQKTLKLPSGEITNAPFILAHARTQLDIIVSTGMASLSEIEQALGVIAFGYLNVDIAPSRKAFEDAYFSDAGQKLLKQKVTVLHCTTEYPAPMEDINLCAMDTIKNAFKLNVGYSDHSEGIAIPIGAVAKGASIIEKHFTLDRNMEGPDHKASLEPVELCEMIRSIRNIELALGNGIKGPRPSEIKNKDVARRSLVATKSIKQGELFTPDNISVKRPGYGISPFSYWDTLGLKASRDYSHGDIIE